MTDLLERSVKKKLEKIFANIVPTKEDCASLAERSLIVLKPELEELQQWRFIGKQILCAKLLLDRRHIENEVQKLLSVAKK